MLLQTHKHITVITKIDLLVLLLLVAVTFVRDGQTESS